MNQLNVSLQHSITALAANGWSHRRIARELDIHRETVGRYLRLADSKPAIVLTGSAPDADLKPAIPLADSEPVSELKPAIPLAGCLVAGRQSLCAPLAKVIESAVSAGLSAQRIYQELICDHAFTGGYHSVPRFVRQLLQTQPVPFVRMEVAAGMEAQVDFGPGAWVRVDGKRKRPHLFRIVLSHSRKAYSEVVWRQTTESFIRCLEKAFRYFGGVPRTLIPDNLRAAVTRADWYDPELNAKVEEFCRHYGTVMLPTRPAMGQRVRDKSLLSRKSEERVDGIPTIIFASGFAAQTFQKIINLRGRDRADRPGLSFDEFSNVPFAIPHVVCACAPLHQVLLIFDVNLRGRAAQPQALPVIVVEIDGLFDGAAFQSFRQLNMFAA